MAGQQTLTPIGKGRESQKRRTRKALEAAAQTLMRAGRQPTIPDVAEAAGISRATAYRYFPTQDILLAEVALFAAGGPLFPAKGDEPVPVAVGHLVRRVGAWALANEQPLRTILRLSLDPSTGVRRPGHRIDWIAGALAPVRSSIDSETYNKLSKALTLMLGIDPIVVMKDIAGASRAETLDALEWSARTLVEAALSTPPTSRPQIAKGQPEARNGERRTRTPRSRFVVEKPGKTKR